MAKPEHIEKNIGRKAVREHLRYERLNALTPEQLEKRQQRLQRKEHRAFLRKLHVIRRTYGPEVAKLYKKVKTNEITVESITDGSISS